MRRTLVVLAILFSSSVALANGEKKPLPEKEKTQQEAPQDRLWGLRLGLITGVTVDPGEDESTDKLLLGENLTRVSLGAFAGYQPGALGVRLGISSTSLEGSNGNPSVSTQIMQNTFQLSVVNEIQLWKWGRVHPRLQLHVGGTFSEYDYSIMYQGSTEHSESGNSFGAVAGVEVGMNFFRHYTAQLGYSVNADKLELKGLNKDADYSIFQSITVGGSLEI